MIENNYWQADNAMQCKRIRERKKIVNIQMSNSLVCLLLAWILLLLWPQSGFAAAFCEYTIKVNGFDCEIDNSLSDSKYKLWTEVSILVVGN